MTNIALAVIFSVLTVLFARAPLRGFFSGSFVGKTGTVDRRVAPVRFWAGLVSNFLAVALFALLSASFIVAGLKG